MNRIKQSVAVAFVALAAAGGASAQNAPVSCLHAMPTSVVEAQVCAGAFQATAPVAAAGFDWQSAGIGAAAAAAALLGAGGVARVLGQRKQPLRA